MTKSPNMLVCPAPIEVPLWLIRAAIRDGAVRRVLEDAAGREAIDRAMKASRK